MASFDMSETIAPKSDQLNAEHLLAGERTVTITDIRGGTDEQPVNIHLAEFPGLPFRPSKTVRRIFVAAWGKDASVYIGRRMTLWNDPAVKWAGQAVGGIRVKAMSDIKKPLVIALTVTKGKRETNTVQPLIEARPAAQPAPTNGITPDQMTNLMAAMKDAGLTVKEAALAYLSQTIGREISASRDLTAEEADLVIHELQNEPAGDES